MSVPAPVELLGYLASILVALSLTLRRLVPLRVVNLLGAVFFTAYGALIQAPPVWGVNAFIVGVNLWHLRSLLGGPRRAALAAVRRQAEAAPPAPPALQAAADTLAAALAAGRPLVLMAGDVSLSLTPDRVEVGWSADEGLSVRSPRP